MRRDELTKAQRWEIADDLAKDRLPAIDKKQLEVVPSKTWYARYGKRALDVVLSGCALIITLPVNALIMVGTFFDVGLPLFFKQQRSGRNGRLFTLVKFRNMKNTVDDRGELLPAAQRVTKFGRFVRRTSLDELLNFASIFKGDMSIIGPRPLPPEYLGRYTKRHKARLMVRPGLECPPRFFDRPWTWQEQFENDVWYVENVSFKVDCMMMVHLVQYAFSAKSAVPRACAKRGIFMGYDFDGCAITLDDVPQSYVDAVAGAAGETAGAAGETAPTTTGAAPTTPGAVTTTTGAAAESPGASDAVATAPANAAGGEASR